MHRTAKLALDTIRDAFLLYEEKVIDAEKLHKIVTSMTKALTNETKFLNRKDK